ncbi:hypothetical protein SWU_01382, partial [Staphylococcus aureus M0173]
AVPTEYFLIENLFNRFGIMPFLFVAVFLLFIYSITFLDKAQYFK